MDWLSTYRASVDCYEKKVTLNVHRTPIISTLKASKLLRQGCRGFIATVLVMDEIEIKIENIPVVKEYPDVLPKDISGLPPDREVKFTIDVLPRTASISKAPYWMAPVEIKELKIQLQELLDKGIVRPSASP